MARDCTINRDPNAPPPPMGPPPPGAPPGGGMARGFDSEYASLMAELGETPNAQADLNKPSWAAGAGGGQDITGGGSNIPPWRRPEAWQTTLNPLPQQGGGGYRPPYGGGAPGGDQYGGGQWAGQGGGGYGGGGGGGGYQQQPQQQQQQYYQGY